MSEVDGVDMNRMQVWTYSRNMAFFFLITPPTVVLIATVLQLVGQYLPTLDSLISETTQAYFLSVFIGPIISFIHTFVLRNVHSRRRSMLRSAWYATLLACLATFSLFRFFILGFDLIMYLVPASFFYGLVMGKLSVNARGELRFQLRPLRKFPLWHYLRNACLFVIIAVIVITVGLLITIKSGIIGGRFVAAPIFLFILAVFLSVVHTYLLQEVSGTSTEVCQRRSMGMSGSLALLVCAVYLFNRQPEFFLFFAAAVIYGWLASYVINSDQAVANGEIHLNRGTSGKAFKGS